MYDAKTTPNGIATYHPDRDEPQRPPPLARRGPPTGDRAGGAPGLLPAQGAPLRRRDRRRGGAAAVAPPRVRDGPARRVRRDRRAHRADRRAHRLRPAHRDRAVREVAAGGPRPDRRGEPLGAQPARPRPARPTSGGCSRSAGSSRAGSRSRSPSPRSWTRAGASTRSSASRPWACTSRYMPAFWTIIAANVLVPQFLWSRAQVQRSIPLLFIISLVVNVGMWFEHFVIVVTICTTITFRRHGATMTQPF